MFNRVFKCSTLNLLCLVFLMVLICQLGASAQAQPRVDLSGKNILILDAYQSKIPVFELTDHGLRAALDAGGVSIKNQFFEHMDLARNPGSEHRKLLVEQMRIRYGHRKLDMIVTLYPEALEFALKDCKNVLRDIPIVALYLPQGNEFPKTGRLIIGHFPTFDIIGTLKIALKLVPRAKRIYVVSGAHEVERRVEDQARRDLKKQEGQLEFRYLSHMPFEDILATVSNAPPGSIVLTLAFGQDVTGKTYTTPWVAQQLSKVSAAPVFGVLSVALGHGIAGGSLISFEHIGTKTGQLALDILRGTKTPENIPNALDVPPVPMFDWRELKRWNLGIEAVPKGSIIVNREFSLWDYKYYIIGGIALLLVQTILVIGLVVQRRRKKGAKESLRQRTEELDQFFNVTLDILGIANTDGYFLRLNPVVEKVLGYTCEELMARQFFDFIHPDDLEKSRGVISTLTSQQKVFSFESRCRCKDGTYRWLEWSASPAGKLIYAAARDVTERKRAEAAYRESERILRQNESDLRRLAGRLIHAQEEERSRLARELHDDLAQRLAVLAIEVGELQKQSMDLPAFAKRHLQEMAENVAKLSQDVHSLSRQLHPSILDDLGFVKAVESECMNFSKREGVEVVFNHENISMSIPKNVSLSLYRIVQEGLRNISKHACAEHISVSLKGIDHDVVLSVQDDGIGFEWAEVQKQPGLGFSSMRERAKLIDGELSIQSQPEKGTVITLKVPLTKEGE